MLKLLEQQFPDWQFAFYQRDCAVDPIFGLPDRISAIHGESAVEFIIKDMMMYRNCTSQEISESLMLKMAHVLKAWDMELK